MLDRNELRRAASVRLASYGSEIVAALDAAAERCGASDLLSDLISSITPSSDEQLSLSQVVDALRAANDGTPISVVFNVAEKFIPLMRDEDPARTIWDLADSISAWFGGGPGVQAAAEAWAGSLLKEHWLPLAFLGACGQ